MAVMSWFKFYPSMVNDPRIKRLSVFERWSLIELMCLASQHGGDRPGTIDLTDEDIAHTLSIELPDWQTLKSKLMTRGLIEFDALRRVFFPDWETRQSNPKSMTTPKKKGKKKDSNEAVRLRMRRMRANRKGELIITADVTGVTGKTENVTGVTGKTENVTGHVTGVTGTVTGVVTGDVTGVTGSAEISSKSAPKVFSRFHVTGSVTGDVTGVTGDVTVPVTPVTENSYNVNPVTVSDTFSAPPLEREEQKKKDRSNTHIDPDRASEEKSGQGDFSQSTEIIMMPILEETAIEKHDRRLRGKQELAPFRDKLGANGIKKGFLEHVLRYLIASTSMKNPDMASARSWIVSREYTCEGMAKIEVQYLAWQESLAAQEQSGMPFVNGKADQSLLKRFAQLKADYVEPEPLSAEEYASLYSY